MNSTLAVLGRHTCTVFAQEENKSDHRFFNTTRTKTAWALPPALPSGGFIIRFLVWFGAPPPPEYR